MNAPNSGCALLNKLRTTAADCRLKTLIRDQGAQFPDRFFDLKAIAFVKVFRE